MLKYYQGGFMAMEVQENDLRDDEEKLNKYLETYDDEVMSFIINNLLYELTAFQIASAYNHDCIWSDSSLKQEYMEAMSFLTFKKPPYSFIDTTKLKAIIEEKYNLKITSENPIKIEPTKK